MSAPTNYTYQWYRGGNIITGQTGNTYVVVAADEGQNITCQVVAVNSAGISLPAISNALAIPVLPTPSNSVVPVITGTVAVGNTLTAGNGTWNNSPTSYTEQWYSTPPASSGSIAPVQSAYALTTTATTVSLNLTSVTVGHLLTVSGTMYDDILITGITGGGTWVKAGSSSTSVIVNNPGTVDDWYCLNSTGGSFTVIITLASAPGASRAIYMATEWPGTWTFGAFSAVSNSGPTTTAATPSVTPTATGSLFLAHGAFRSYVGNNVNDEPSTGFAAINLGFYTSAYQCTSVDYAISTTAAEQCTWTMSSSTYYSSSMVTFVPTSTSATPISGATGQTYVIQSSDEGNMLSVAVTAKNLSGQNTAFSANTIAVPIPGAILEV